MANQGSAARLEEGSEPAGPQNTVAPIHSPASGAMVVIPARDEAAAVAGVVRRIRALELPVVVVDDYSSDRTAEIAAAAGAVVLRLPFHAGSWAAIQTGMRYACNAGCSYVITVDADGQHEPDEIDTLFATLHGPPPCNVAIGACIGRANRRRRIAWRFLRWLSGLGVEDLTSGFRLYDRTAIELLAREDHTLLEYQDVGVLLCLREAGLAIRETPVEMLPRRHGVSRIFRSWPMVAYYLIYSSLIGTSRRRRPSRDRA